MGKGGYNGGSTTFGPGSDWFSYSKPKPKKKPKTPKSPEHVAERQRVRADSTATVITTEPAALEIVWEKSLEKAERKKAEIEAKRLRLLKKEERRREIAERRQNDPRLAAEREYRKKSEGDRMASVIIEVKNKRAPKITDWKP